MKKRRGRQPRQTLVTTTCLKAITKLTSQVGAPIFLEDEGFRDISGWLKHIKESQFRPAWFVLCESYIRESECFDDKTLEKLKEDLVQEIMKLVISRHPKESPKVVNTNARRQSKVSTSRQTLRNIFEAYLAETKELQRPSETKNSTERSEAGSSRSHARLKERRSSPLVIPSMSSRSPDSMVQGSTAGMEISLLLTNDGVAMRRSSASSKLPSMTQFDEEIRVRSEKDNLKKS